MVCLAKFTVMMCIFYLKYPCILFIIIDKSGFKTQENQLFFIVLQLAHVLRVIIV